MVLADRLAKFITSPRPLIALWWLGGMLTIFIPRSQWNSEKDQFYQAYGKNVEYARNQKAAQQAQGGYYANNNNSYNLNCGWWQYQCRKNQYALQQQMYGGGNNNGNNNQMFRTPNWYQFLGGVNEEEDRQMREAMGMEPDAATGSTKFVYVWSVILFLALLVFGTYVLSKKKHIGYLIFSLAMMVQYSFFMLLLLPQGVISTDDRDVEETIYGWFGQLPVLMLFFYYAQIWFGAVSLGLFAAWTYGLNKLKGDAPGSLDDPMFEQTADVVKSTGEKVKESVSKLSGEAKKIASALARDPVYPDGETTAGFQEASKLGMA